MSLCAGGRSNATRRSGELLASMAGAPMVAVPYRGSGPAVTDLLGGTVPAAMVDLTSAYPHVKAGKLVALGVTSPARSKVAPGIPTIAEEGVKGYRHLRGWACSFLRKRPPTFAQCSQLRSRKS